MTARPDGFVAVAQVADIPDGTMKCVAVEGERMVLMHVAARFYGLRDMCGHRNAPLSRGRLDGHVIECPLHFAQFDVRDGRLIDGPVSASVPVYEVLVEGETVFVRRA